MKNHTEVFSIISLSNYGVYSHNRPGVKSHNSPCQRLYSNMIGPKVQKPSDEHSLQP